MVVSLRSSLQAKERELTDVMDRYLQEKVGAAKTQGELAAVSARLDTAQQHINSLQTKASIMHVHMYVWVLRCLLCMCVYIACTYPCSCQVFMLKQKVKQGMRALGNLNKNSLEESSTNCKQLQRFVYMPMYKTFRHLPRNKQNNTTQATSEEVFFREKCAVTGGIRTHDALLSR